ncbi:MAG: hypothetical protein GY750_13805 [Lentisphaerae bacterium]|nr:hypothetical protein [Lentisphaerota bacterium]
MANITSLKEDISNGDIFHILPDGKILSLYNKNSQDITIVLTEKCNQDCLICAQPQPQPCKHNNDFLNIFNRMLLNFLIEAQIPYIGISG